MRILITITLVFSMLTLIASATAFAAVPGQIHVEGVLLNSAGGTVPDGSYKVTFKLYESEAAKQATWSEVASQLAVKSGRFRYQLGVNKPIQPGLVAKMKAAHLAVAVGVDPELPRIALASVAYAMVALRADGLACSGCVTAAHLQKGSVGTDKVGFPYAGAKTKGGPASVALDLNCSGCVSTQEIKANADLDLGSHGLKAAKVTATAIASGSVVANSFVGDGSKLTGIKTPAGSCKVKGHVVSGIAADGSLLCIEPPSASLPPDGLDEISNDLLTNQFVDSWASAKATPITDNNPIGVSNTIEVSDVGLAQSLQISAKISNSNIATIKVVLFDPANVTYVLHDKSGSGKLLQTSWPKPSKPVSGDLGKWVGKNPKGKWRLKVIDSSYHNNKDDGAIESWSVSIKTLSSKVVAAKGLLLTTKGVNFASSGTQGLRFELAEKDPVVCDASQIGYVYFHTKVSSLMLCDGTLFQVLATFGKGLSKANAGESCKKLLDSGSKNSGVYWISATGKIEDAFQVYCDMTTDGGGWTLAMRFKNDSKLVWSSAYWTNTSLFNDAGKGLDPATNANAKFKSFTAVPGTTIRGCKGATGPCIKQSWGGAKTLHKLFNEGYKSGSMSRNALVSMFGNDSKQPNCNKSGINTNFTYGGARLGLVGNNENDCNTCDSGWGWGTYGNSNKNSGCGCGLAGWSVPNKCYQGTLWIR